MIDTHCHLDDAKLDAKSIIETMKIDGLEKIITIGTSVTDIENVVNIAENNSDVYACIAIHPYYADSLTGDVEEKMAKLSKSSKVVGIGEFGLDYHDYPGAPSRDEQRRAFVSQIKLADKLSLPICLHIRDAHGDALEILKENSKYINNSGIIHCFSGSPEVAREYVKLGFYISFSGSITYKKSYEEIIKAVPLNRMLFETDSPYLAPQGLRGTINVPKNTIITAEFVADKLGLSYSEIEKIERENVLRLFKKIK